MHPRTWPLAAAVLSALAASLGAQELSAPRDLRVHQVAYDLDSAVRVRWERAGTYDTVLAYVDGEATGVEVDGALLEIVVPVSAGEHAIGVQGVSGSATSEVASVQFDVLAETPVPDPVRGISCTFDREIGLFHFRWQPGADTWVEGEIRFPGTTAITTVPEGTTEIDVAPADGGDVALVAFRNDAGYFSEPEIVVCNEILPAFIRGDCDLSGRVEFVDALVELNVLFLEAPRWKCDDACDANDDGDLDLTDPITVLQYLFLEGPPPPFPGPERCDIDPTIDFLGGRCRCPGE